MYEMLKEVTDFILKLLSLPGSNRGWKIASILFFLALGCWFLETQIGLVFFWYLERKVSLLKELNSLAQNNVTQNSDLSPIYHNLVGELAQRSSSPLIFTPSFAVVVWKFFSGASVSFVLLVLALLVGARPDDQDITLDQSMTGFVLLGLFFGFIGVFLPFISPLWNYLGFPLTQVLLFFFIGLMKAVMKR
jgi:hypothetical protein